MDSICFHIAKEKFEGVLLHFTHLYYSDPKKPKPMLVCDHCFQLLLGKTGPMPAKELPLPYIISREHLERLLDPITFKAWVEFTHQQVQ